MQLSLFTAVEMSGSWIPGFEFNHFTTLIGSKLNAPHPVPLPAWAGRGWPTRRAEVRRRRNSKSDRPPKPANARRARFRNCMTWWPGKLLKSATVRSVPAANPTAIRAEPPVWQFYQRALGQKRRYRAGPFKSQNH
jgi:hypothetical protein